MQVGEREQRCPGFPEFHVRAGDLVQHPGRDQPLLSGRTQDTQEDTCGVPFPFQLLHVAAKEGMPRIVNPEDSPDTGRMAEAPLSLEIETVGCAETVLLVEGNTSKPHW